ncbi:integrating conjugative element protein, PFL_4709 family [Methylomonas methanica MC09]|uniref:Integrating conjugative element protein, PFL_4709 family n=2 Tax=Methylomonas methanica TaxID=421 RepID=G0A5A9_METMM|nr:integrating conjugative element protein, PFL_4709 family [Methylomonas methanica MC09]
MGLLVVCVFPTVAQEIPSAQDKPVIEVIVRDADRVIGLANLRQQGYDVKVYNLDAPKLVFTDLSQNLPANQEAAKRTLEQRMQQRGRQALQQQLIAAYQGLSVAIQYQVDRYPAVLFDRGQAVIYGVTDLQQVLDLYRQWQSGLDQ